MLAALVALVAYAMSDFSRTAAGAQTLGPSEVRTIAGDGKPGISDGPNETASFLLPVGIAIANDGTIFVADQLAQRIRTISHGVVKTVAGGGAVAVDRLSVTGGYVDGPAEQARFNWPSGIALGPDGALYIADSNNQCIRRLLHGVVSTVVGKQGQSSAVDGDATTGRFVDPRAVAFDRAGNLYIADFGGGLRRWSPTGQLTTIDLKADLTKSMLGVAVDTADADGTVVVSSPDRVLSYNPKTGASEAFGTTTAEGDRIFGKPDGLVALNHREFLFTDPSYHTIRYMRLPLQPFVGLIFTRTIAGGANEREADNAGFVDGSRAAARFYDPAGIAVRGQTAYIADAGNRRIRTVHLPRMVTAEAGTSDVVPTDDKHNEIAYLGASSAYYDSLGDDSICGQVEHALNASGRYRLPVRCHPMRIDGAPMTALSDYILNYAMPEGIKLVIMQGSPDSGSPEHIPQFVAMMQKLVDGLKENNAHLIVAWAYSAEDFEAAEDFVARERTTRGRQLPSAGWHLETAGVVPLSQALVPLGIPQLDFYPTMLRYEQNGGPPLYNTNGEGHPTRRTNTFAANLLSKFILSLPASKTGLK